MTTLISNHTFSNLVLRPNGVHPETIGHDGLPVGDAPDEEALQELGARMAAQNGYANKHGWELYDTTGTTEDWSYNATGGFGYTFEIGPDEFHPPFPEVVDEYLGAGQYAGQGNREAYLIALENAVDPRAHSVLTGRAPKGATLRLSQDVRLADLGRLVRGPPGDHDDRRARRPLHLARQPLHPPGRQDRQVETVSRASRSPRTSWIGTTAPLQSVDQEFAVTERRGPARDRPSTGRRPTTWTSRSTGRTPTAR